MRPGLATCYVKYTYTCICIKKEKNIYYIGIQSLSDQDFDAQRKISLPGKEVNLWDRLPSEHPWFLIKKEFKSEPK